MEALTLDRNMYRQTLDDINEMLAGDSYANQFVVKFPDGVNTASVLEICRTIQAPSFENKVKLMRICIAAKNVEVTCPNGDVEKFCMTNVDDNLEGFPLFEKDPLALIAIADAVYGYILKKYVRLSKPKAEAAQNAE